MTPGFPKTWKPRCPPTWAAARLPCPPFPSHRPGAQLSTYSWHSSGTPEWDTHGPCPAPRPGAGVQEPPQGRARWLRRAGMPSGRANRYGGIVGRPPASPPTPGTGARDSSGFGRRGERGARAQGKGKGGRRGGGERGVVLTSRRAGAGRASPQPRSRVSEAPRRGAGGSLRGPQGGGGADAGAGGQLGHTLTRPAGSCVLAPASPLPPAPTAPQAAPQARAEPARVPRRLGALSGRVPPCPCPRLPSGDPRPAPLHGALLYPSRCRWPCRARARGLSPCARLPRSAPEPSGRGPAGVARPRNSMQLRPPPSSSPASPPGPGGRPQRPPCSAFARTGSWGSGLGSAAGAALLRGSGAPTPTPSPCQ